MAAPGQLDLTPTTFESLSWRKHAKIFEQQRLIKLSETNALTDVTLVAGSQENAVEIPAHRAILSMASEYFWELFVDKDSMARSHQIKMAGIDPQALQAIITFIYTGRIEIMEDLCEKLFITAEVLEILFVQFKTLQYMEKNINKTNCGRRLTFGRHQNCQSLTDAAVAFINSCYAEFLAERSFLDLDLSEVIAVLHCDGRNNTPEEDVFTAVVKWLKCDKDQRIKHSAILLKEIDLTILPEDFLQFHFITEKVLRTFDSLQLYNKVLKHVDEIKESSLHSELFEDPIYIVQHPPVRQLPTTKLSPIQSSSNDKRVYEETATIDTKKKKLKMNDDHNKTKTPDVTTSKIATTTNTSSSSKMVARKRTGGLSQHYTPPVSKIRDATEVLFQQKSIAKAKTKAQKGVDNCSSSKPSVTGSGRGSSKSVHGSNHTIQKSRSSVRAFSDTKSQQVIVYLRERKESASVMIFDFHEMSRPKRLREFHRNNKSCTLLWDHINKRLYALGGVTSTQQEIASSKETKYATQSALFQSRSQKCWLNGPGMEQERNNFVSVVLDGYIYAFGGSEGILGNQAVNCAERLCLTESKPKWEETDYLQRARQGFGATVLNGKIYVVGGYGAAGEHVDATMGILNTVEVYDPKEDTWTFVSSMDKERHGLSVVTYKSKIYAIGGGGHKSHVCFKDDIETMKSVEVYDPETDRWEPIANLNCPRKNGYAVVLHGTIYAVGGDHSKGEDVVESSVEKYNFVKNKWSMVCRSLDKEGNFMSVAVMDLPDNNNNNDNTDDDDDDEDEDESE